MNRYDSVGVESHSALWADLGLGNLFARLRRRKWLWVALPLFWIVFSNVAFRYAETAYASELLVVPASVGSNNSSVSGLSGALSSFGLDIGGAGASKDEYFMMYLESWTSSWFADQLLANKEMTQKIFSDIWSPDQGGWVRSAGLGGFMRSFVGGLFGWTPATRAEPRTEDMLLFIRSHIKEVNVRDQVTTRITVEHKDPLLARQILSFGHASINGHLAELFRKRTDQNVGYILGQLNKVSVAEYRQALLTTLTQTERVRMLAFANPEFAASSLSLYTTAQPVRPRAVQIVALSLAAALGCCLALAFFGDFLRLPLRLGKQSSGAPQP